MIAIAKLFDIVPGWAWALIVAGLAASNFVTGSRLYAEKLAHQTAKTEYAQRVADAERQRADAESRNRQTEKELQDAIEAHAPEVAAVSADLAAARDRGRAGSQRVRDAAAATAELAAQACAASSTARVRETAADAARVLALVLGEFEQRATTLAGIADERGIAGRACERTYNDAREKLKGTLP